MAQLRWSISEAEREATLSEWGVVRATKKRKWQLVQRIWSPDFCEYVEYKALVRILMIEGTCTCKP